MVSSGLQENVLCQTTFVVDGTGIVLCTWVLVVLDFEFLDGKQNHPISVAGYTYQCKSRIDDPHEDRFFDGCSKIVPLPA